MLSMAAEKTKKHCPDAAQWQEESRLGNRRRLFARWNIFCLCISSGRLSLSGKSKLDSKGVSGCRENWETLCSCWSVRRSEPPRKSSLPIRAANFFGLCISLGRLSLSGKSKRDSKGVSCCRENWATLCICSSLAPVQKNSIFSATTDSIGVQFRFSRQT
jgi:hypothetical protein